MLQYSNILHYPEVLVLFQGQLPQPWYKAYLTERVLAVAIIKNVSLEWEHTGYDSYRPEWESIKDELILASFTSWSVFSIPANRLCHSSLRSSQHFLFYTVSIVRSLFT